MTELNNFLSTETTPEIAKIFGAIEKASFILSKEVVLVTQLKERL